MSIPRLIKSIYLVLTAGILLLFLGCAFSHQQVTKTKAIPYRPTEISEVKVFEDIYAIDNPDYFILKDISESYEGPGGLDDDSVKQVLKQNLKEKAAKLGANGLVILSYKSQEYEKKGNFRYQITGSALKRIELFTQGSTPVGNYQILGKVWARVDGTPMNPGTPEKVQDLLKQDAITLGAEAVVDYYHSYQGDDEKLENGCWGSALAVRYSDDTDTNFTRPAYTVAIRPWSVTDDSNGHKLKTSLGLFGSTAQYYLEKRGYHATVPENTLSQKELGRHHLSKKKDNYEDIYGDKTELILLIDFNGNLTQSANKISSIKASLFSKSIGEIVWSNEVLNLEDREIDIFDLGRSRGDYNLGLIGTYELAEDLFADLPEIDEIENRIDNENSKSRMNTKIDDSRIYDLLDTLAIHAPEYALYNAVMEKNKEKAKELIKLGADVNFRHYSDNTPLHTAVSRGDHNMVRMLLNNGANPTLKNYLDLTPLELAEKLHSPNYDLSYIQKLLIDYGASEQDPGNLVEELSE